MKKYPAIAAVEFRDVSFGYPGAEAKVVSGLSFTAEAGKTTAIIGSTGAGKTTLLNLIPRLYDADSGEVLINGVPTAQMTRKGLSSAIAAVPQKPFLFSGTVASNLRFGARDASEEQLWEALEIAQAADFVKEREGELESAISQGGTNVSGGQRQRLCIARALLKKPKILILDDSTSAVDTKTDKLIRTAFHDEIPDTTKIIIAQRIASVQESDMILVMEEGRITASGTHEELLRTCDEYRSIYESQTKNQAQPEELK